MLTFRFGEGTNGAYRVLAIGSHADDIEIGCGGTLLRLAESCPALEVCWVVLSAAGRRRTEATRSAKAFLANVANRRVVLGKFRDGFLPYRRGDDLKEFFETLKGEFAPDLIFTHQLRDHHQDHRLVSELTWNTFRDHCILEYEIPKYDGDFGSPNVFVHLSDSVSQRKVELILDHFFSSASGAGLPRICSVP